MFQDLYPSSCYAGKENLMHSWQNINQPVSWKLTCLSQSGAGPSHNSDTSDSDDGIGEGDEDVVSVKAVVLQDTPRLRGVHGSVRHTQPEERNSWWKSQVNPYI